MRRSYISHVRSLSFTLLVGCHAAEVQVVDESSTAAAPAPEVPAGAVRSPEAKPSTVQPSGGSSMVAPPALTPKSSGGAPSNTVAPPTLTPTMNMVGAAGAPPPAPRAEDKVPGKVELRCVDGAPGQLPTGYALIAADIENPWTIDAGTLSWLDTRDREGWTLWQKPANAAAVSAPAEGITSGPDLVSSADTLAAAGGELFVRVSQLAGREGRVAMRQVPGQTLADEAGRGLGVLAVDPDAVYWLAAEDQQISLYRTPRKAAETSALGRVPFGWATGAQTRAFAAGVVALGDYVYAALSSSGRGQLYRAGKGGNQPAAPFGDELSAIAGLTKDGADLLLVLDPVFDELGNPREPARIARMTVSGELHEITPISFAGPSYGEMNVAVSGGRVYWIQNPTQGFGGALWSAALDGSDAPTKELTVLENPLGGGLQAEDGAVYFALYCLVYKGAEVSGRTHVLRFQP